jgi:hypothetical protein
MDRFFLKILFFSLVFVTDATAKVEVGNTTPVPLPDRNIQSIQAMNMNSFIPENLEAGDQQLLTKFADRGLQKLMSSPEMKSSALVRTVEKAKFSAKTSIRKHSFQFDVQALQGSARVKYSGWTDLELKYDSRLAQSILGLGWKF